MAQCTNCRNSIKWSRSLKANATYKPLTCNNCRFKQEVTKNSRLIIVLLTLGPVWIFGIIWPVSSNTIITVTANLVMAVAGMLLTPFFVTYKEARYETREV